MLLALVLGIMLGIAGRVLLLQWFHGALEERRPQRTTLLAAEFPRLAPPVRLPARPVRPARRAPMPMPLVRRAA